MAIDRKEFIHKVMPGLKTDKSYTKFFYRFKVEDRSYYKVFDYSDKNWDKRTRMAMAIQEAYEYKEKIKNPKTDLNENIKLNDFIYLHFKNLPDTNWTKTKIRHYENYIKKFLGNKKVKDIKQLHIKESIKYQEEQELSSRTVKTTLEILNPAFNEAKVNMLISFNPCEGITIKRDKTKKLVLDASQKLQEIIDVIYTVFKDDPFYLSFYLFAIQGRRKSEILNLRWEYINFDKDLYYLDFTKNGEEQIFALPEMIKIELLKFRKRAGWVYESPINPGARIVNVEKQTNKIKKILPYFTLHYLRNIIVSAMGDIGVSKTFMSGALGHNNVNTIDKYLSLNYIEGSKAANETIKRVINSKKNL